MNCRQIVIAVGLVVLTCMIVGTVLIPQWQAGRHEPLTDSSQG